MVKTTFLKEDQIWGDDALDVLKVYGTKVAPTELAAVLGAAMPETGLYSFWTSGSDRELTGSSWSISPCGTRVRCIGCDGEIDVRIPIFVSLRHVPLYLHRLDLDSLAIVYVTIINLSLS